MVRNGYLKCAGYVVLYFLYSRVAKLLHTVALLANEVVVLFVGVAMLELRRGVFGKLVLYHQLAREQQIQRVIHRGTAHVVVPVFHFYVQCLHIEMVGAGVYLLQNSKAFGRFSMPVFF